MLKKYILALSILGLALPGSATAGLGLGLFAGHVKEAIKSPRFLLGIASAIYHEITINNYNHKLAFNKDNRKHPEVVRATEIVLLPYWPRKILGCYELCNFFLSKDNRMPLFAMGNLTAHHSIEAGKFIAPYISSFMRKFNR